MRGAHLLPDLERQVDVLTVRSRWIPQKFLAFHRMVSPWVAPNTGFEPWPYQLKLYENLFRAWFERKDIVVQQTRQSGKTVPTAIWLAYMICEERCMTVILSSKSTKTKKMARYLIKIMKRYGLREGGLNEARFDDEAGFVAMSGKPESEREGDTAHIVVVDEGQDVPYEPVYGDVSPMRAGTKGIVVVMGIGGTSESFIRRMKDSPRVLRVEIPYTEACVDRPSYLETVENDRHVMTPQEFDAHYMVKDIDGAATALIPYLLPYNERYPGKTYDPNTADHIQIGIDWGNRVDYTAVIAAGFHYSPFDRKRDRPQEVVLFGYALFRGVGWDTQLDLVVDFINRTPVDKIRPEFNNIGDPMSEFLLKRLQAEVDEEGNQRYDLTTDDRYEPVYATVDNIAQASRDMCVLSYSQSLLYAPDIHHPKVGLHDACANALRKVTVSYTVGNKMKTDHCDWLSALRTMFSKGKTAYLVGEAA